jgi:mannose-6-phosphate isomerase-like protein (cupin superfamily)
MGIVERLNVRAVHPPRAAAAPRGPAPEYGDLYVDKVTGEHAVVLRGGGAGRSLLVHLLVTPGGAVTGQHIHPALQERFRVLRGRLGTRVAGVDRTLEVGEEVTVPPGTEHDWWNAGENEASVLVELTPGDPRFVDMIATLFGLANAGKCNDKGQPGLMQSVLIGHEFEDVIVFTAAPRWVQRIAYAVLGPIARMRGLRGIYREYLGPQGKAEPDREALAAAGMEPPAAAVAAA